MALLREETAVYKAETGAHVTDIELLASTMTGKVAVNEQDLEKARQLITKAGNLHSISRMTIKEIESFEVVYGSEARRIYLSMEMGRRSIKPDMGSKPRITCSKDAYECLVDVLQHLEIEEFWVLCLNKANQVTDRFMLSRGGTAGTVVDIKIVMRELLLRKCSGFIVSHNHPSGNLQPSQADMDLTRKMKKSGEVMDILLLDHIIVSSQGYYSFGDEGVL